ncbi:uncharacterized protein BX663DRAFT_536904 [Cokeromyces recurvatus]|uniref:uncharacterized protein n=1 Tax=Cokeromyces recurvatus TaxID=90255 RepID=UPI00221F2035|nr:uncharacterized protein BX663DRAFT_536904 [Cokeromyces recurvatus]KAI7901900.1 hypothetical protein BX663DRAFT_536904 [Cokeromyces recurvatus]
MANEHYFIGIDAGNWGKDNTIYISARAPQSVDEAFNYEDNKLNVILWANHRATDQANRINATHHSVLCYVGNTIKNLPSEKWASKATGLLAHSACSLTYKCSYLPSPVGQGQDIGELVSSAVIDAYAGAIATLIDEMLQSPEKSLQIQGSSRLAIICGTLSCHITMSPKSIFVPEAEEKAKIANQTIYSFLSNSLSRLQTQQGLSYLEDLTQYLHISDPSLRGSMVGISLDKSIDDLAIKYMATLQAISCQTLHIIETLNKEGYKSDTLCISLFIRLLADMTQCRIFMPELVESAVVISTAAGSSVLPRTDEGIKKINQRCYKVFLAMFDDQKKYRQMMNE